MPKKLPYERRPGKRGIFAEFPTELVVALHERAEKSGRLFRKELELAARYWLTLPVGFTPEGMDLSEPKSTPRTPRKKKESNK